MEIGVVVGIVIKDAIEVEIKVGIEVGIEVWIETEWNPWYELLFEIQEFISIYLLLF